MPFIILLCEAALRCEARVQNRLFYGEMKDGSYNPQSEIVRPCYQRKHWNNCESKILAALRDALLPKLLSGEITVKDAEKGISEVI